MTNAPPIQPPPDETGGVIRLAGDEPAQTVGGLLAMIDAARRYELDAVKSEIDAIDAYTNVAKRLVQIHNSNGKSAALKPTAELIPLREIVERHIKGVIENTPTLKAAASVLGIGGSTIYRRGVRRNGNQIT